jgi:DNA methylase/ParB-like nuclease domain
LYALVTRAAPPVADHWRNSIVRYADERPDSLLAHPLNPKIHPKQQQDALAGAISEVGWLAPVIVNETTGHVIDGHARIGLAISRGESSVPVAYVELTEEAERLALATFDPIGNLALMDDDSLSRLLEGLSPADEAVANLLRDLAPPRQKALNPDDADLTPPAEPVTRAGDLWLLGEHRLLCGDAFDETARKRLIGPTVPSALVTDPPYGVSIVQVSNGRATVGGAKPFGSRRDVGTIGGPNIAPNNYYRPVLGDDRPFDPTPLLGLAKTVVLWGANYYADKLPSSSGWIVWDKREREMEPNTFADCELGWTNRDQPARIFRHLWMGLMKSSERGERRVHPTQKPVALYVWLLEQFTLAGDVFMDLFAGSGPAVVAAEQTGRTALLVEADGGYCDVIVNRWEHVTGRKAERVGQAVEAYA